MMIIIITESTYTILLSLILFHLTQAQAQPNSPAHDTDPNYGGNFSPSMGVIIIVLIAALFFMGFFSIYIRHCSDDPSTTNAPVRRGIGSIRRSRRAPRGLDPTVIKSFPTFDYAAVKSAKIGKGALECAVCLTEFQDDDTLRLIPKCDHVFHPDCIDAWLVGHTTCPVCRCNLSDTSAAEDNSNTDILGSDVNEASPQEELNQIVENETNNEESESMEQPLHGRITRNRTMRNLSFGRPRLWFGNKYSRSYSTGHVAVRQWENMERFTLRLPEELRKQIMSGKLERSTSLVVLPRESSSTRGYRTGFGEGSSSSRPGRFGGSVRGDRTNRSDRWVFTLAPPFITRAPSLKSPNKVGPMSQSGSLRDAESIRENASQSAMQAELTQLPV